MSNAQGRLTAARRRLIAARGLLTTARGVLQLVNGVLLFINDVQPVDFRFKLFYIFTTVISINIFLEIDMNTTPEHDKKIAAITFAAVFPHYIAKIEKKGRTREELLQVIKWLTDFDEPELQELIQKNVTFETFFQLARVHPNAHLITGAICGYRVEDIENPLTRNIRYLDKLVDELAKGKKMEKILRDA